MVSRTKAQSGNGDTDAVDEFMQQLDHPLKPEMQAVRAIILGTSPQITEAIKWNAPSFACKEHFATFNPRAKDAVQVIFHLGAKVKAIREGELAISDPAGLLHWLAQDRAAMKLKDMAAINASKAALEAIVRQWIVHVQ